MTVYTQDGFLEDLPGLIYGRFNHACGHFVNSKHEVVSLSHYVVSSTIFSIRITQVYMVTGGYDFSELSSTEIFIEGSSQWTEAGALPPRIGIQTTTTNTTNTTTTTPAPTALKTVGIRGVSFNNKVFVTGDLFNILSQIVDRR